MSNASAISTSNATEPAALSLRRSLQWVTYAWFFGATWMYITNGAALSRFAQLMRMPNLGFGLMASLPFAAALVQLPTSYVVERFGHHKSIFITAGILHRAVWILIAMMPWMLPADECWKGMLAGIFLSALLANIGAPVSYAWMGDLVPRRIRGRYFSRRTQLGQFIGLFVTLGSGLLLDRAQSNGSDVLRNVIAVIFILAALCGTMDFLCFLPVPAPVKNKPNPNVRLWPMMRQPLTDRNFRHFLGFTAMMTFATGYLGQFVWLYLFDVGHMSNTRANAMLTIFPLIITMSCYPLWGRLIDRFGRKPVLVISGLLIVKGAAAWMFVTPETWVIGYAGVLIATFAWPGMELANFNILLGMSQSLGGRRYGTAYIAMTSFVTAVAGILSGLFGGAIAQWLEHWHGMLFGWPLTYHSVLFLLSSGLRLVALVFLIGLEDKGAYSTRMTLRYMGSLLYSNAQLAVVVPARVIYHIARATYRLKDLKRPD